MKIHNLEEQHRLIYFAEKYFKDSEVFDFQITNVGYGWVDYELIIKGSGRWFKNEHQVATFSDGEDEITLKDNSYFSDIERFILEYEKKFPDREIELVMKKDINLEE